MRLGVVRCGVKLWWFREQSASVDGAGSRRCIAFWRLDFHHNICSLSVMMELYVGVLFLCVVCPKVPALFFCHGGGLRGRRTTATLRTARCRLTRSWQACRGTSKNVNRLLGLIDEAGFIIGHSWPQCSFSLLSLPRILRHGARLRRFVFPRMSW